MPARTGQQYIEGLRAQEREIWLGGERVGRSFSNPKTREELETRSQMMLNWARTTNGMMGRSPDFMNVTFAAWGAAADFFGEKRPEFGQNMRDYVEFRSEE